MVIASALLQGTSIPFVARLLDLSTPLPGRSRFGMELEHREESESELVELVIPPGSPASGKQIVNLGLPFGTLIILIAKGKEQFSPRGDTVLEEGDTLLTLTTSDNVSAVRRIILNETSSEQGNSDLHETGFPIDFLRRFR